MTPTRARLAGGVAVLLMVVALSGLLPEARPGQDYAGEVDIPATGRSLLMCPIGPPKASSTLDLGVYPATPPPNVAGDTGLTAKELAGGEGNVLDDVGVQLDKRGQAGSYPLHAEDHVGVLVDGRGELAEGLWASVSSIADAGVSAGLATARCQPNRPEYLFVGLSEAQGQHTRIQLVNPDKAAARVDLELYDSDGPLPDAESRTGITVPGSDRRTLNLDMLAPGRTRLAAHVRVTSGRVAAFALQTADAGEESGGTDWLESSAKGTVLVLPGVSPSVDKVALSLLTLGADSGTATIEVIDATGVIRPAGHETAQLTPGKVTDVDLSGVFDGAAAAVRVTSEVQVAGGLTLTAGRKLSTGPVPKPDELALSAPAAALPGPVAFAGPAEGTSAALQLTALGTDASVDVEIRERDGSRFSTRTVKLSADTTRRIELGTTARDRQVVVVPADPDSVVGVVTLQAAGAQPRLSLLPLG